MHVRMKKKHESPSASLCRRQEGRPVKEVCAAQGHVRSSMAVVLPTPALFLRPSLQAQGTSSSGLTGSRSSPWCHCLCIILSSLPREMRTALSGEAMVWPVWIPNKPSVVFKTLWANIRSSRPCGSIVTVQRYSIEYMHNEQRKKERTRETR